MCNVGVVCRCAVHFDEHYTTAHPESTVQNGCTQSHWNVVHCTGAAHWKDGILQLPEINLSLSIRVEFCSCHMIYYCRCDT